MRAPLITITCDCGATAEVAYGDRWTLPDVREDVGHDADSGRRVRRPRPRCAADTGYLVLGPPIAARGDPDPAGRPRRDPVRVPPLRARDGVGAARRPAAPAPHRRPHAGAARRAGSCGRSSRARHPTQPHERGHPERLGQPPGDARHLRRAVRAGGDRARRRCGGRVGAAADHRQRRRGAARADLARDEVRVHRHRRRSRTRSRRRRRSRVSLAVEVERLRLCSPRPIEALLELVAERAPGLLVVGPDRDAAQAAHVREADEADPRARGLPRLAACLSAPTQRCGVAERGAESAAGVLEQQRHRGAHRPRASKRDAGPCTPTIADEVAAAVEHRRGDGGEVDLALLPRLGVPAPANALELRDELRPRRDRARRERLRAARTGARRRRTRASPSPPRSRGRRSGGRAGRRSGRRRSCARSRP